MSLLKGQLLPCHVVEAHSPKRPQPLRVCPKVVLVRADAAAGGAQTAQEPTADDRVRQQQHVTASQCPFGHQAASLMSTSSSIVSMMPRELAGMATHGEPVGQQQQLPSGPGWSVLAPGQKGDYAPAQGRFCWNFLLGEMLELEYKGAGPFMLQRYREFGSVFSWQLGNQQVTSILDYETIRSMLQLDGKVVSGWSPPSVYAMLGENTRRNMENPANRMAVRKMLAPGFSTQALSAYLDKMEAIVSNQLDEWVAAGPIDLSKEGKALSFEFSTKLLVDFDIPKEQKQALRAKFDRLFTGLISPPINLPGFRFHSGVLARKELIQDVKELLHTRPDPGTSSQGQKSRTSVFDYALEANRVVRGKETLSDEDVAASGISLIIAGNDTSGLGITALLGLLPLLPDVMQKLRHEQEQLVAVHGPKLRHAVLASMPYADAVVKEVLRFSPPATGIFRKTLVDMQVGGAFVPAGSIVHFSFFIAQLVTDPSLWSAAEDGSDYREDEQPQHTAAAEAAAAVAKQQHCLQAVPADSFRLINKQLLQQDFRPERWLVQAEPDSHAGPDSQAGPERLHKPSGLLTFGSGPHTCLGMSLFYMEARALLALLARSYTLEFEGPEPYGVKVGFLPRGTQPCMLRVGRR